MEKLGLDKFLDKKLDNLKSVQGGRATEWSGGIDEEYYNGVMFDDGVWIAK